MSDHTRLPMRAEDSARGVAAAVYHDVRLRLPFVPAFVKALAATSEDALVEAWLQARALFDDPEAAAGAERLQVLADPRLDYSASRDVREAVAPFAAELPMLLLVVTSLALTLDGVIPAGERPPADLSGSGPLPEAVPEEPGEHELFDEICSIYDTTYVPSMYRSLAALGSLEEPWRAIGPYLASVAGSEHARRVSEAAEREAVAATEVACLSSEDARPVLAQFRRALPKNLVFAAAVLPRGVGWPVGGHA